MRIKLTLAQLEAFLAVAEQGSFRGAARLLNLSQPALSRTIRLTEESVGARLLDRDRKHAALTPAGSRLVPIARRILREFDDSVSELGHFIQGGSGLISVATLPSIASAILPRAMALFQKDNPDVSFQLRDGAAASLLASLDEGESDFAITVAPQVADRYAFQPLLSDEFVLVCRRDDPIARMAIASWQTFAKRPFIAVAGASSVRALTDTAFRREGVSVTPRIEVSSWALAGRLVGEGLGLAAMPRLTVGSAEFGQLVFRPLRPELRREIGIVTLRDRTLSPISLRFLTCVLASARTDMPDRQEVTARSSSDQRS